MSVVVQRHARWDIKCHTGVVDVTPARAAPSKGHHSIAYRARTNILAANQRPSWVLRLLRIDSGLRYSLLWQSSISWPKVRPVTSAGALGLWSLSFPNDRKDWAHPWAPLSDLSFCFCVFTVLGLLCPPNSDQDLGPCTEVPSEPLDCPSTALTHRGAFLGWDPFPGPGHPQGTRPRLWSPRPVSCLRTSACALARPSRVGGTWGCTVPFLLSASGWP